MSREQSNMNFFIQPQKTTSHLIGVAYSTSADGFTSAEFNEYQSNYRLHFAQWVCAATAASYAFDVDLLYTNNGANGIQVTKNGALMTYAATAASADEYYADADGITFGAALTNGDVVIAMYELADTAVDVE
jgi:hypothetical protein